MPIHAPCHRGMLPSGGRKPLTAGGTSAEAVLRAILLGKSCSINSCACAHACLAQHCDLWYDNSCVHIFSNRTHCLDCCCPVHAHVHTHLLHNNAIEGVTTMMPLCTSLTNKLAILSSVVLYMHMCVRVSCTTMRLEGHNNDYWNRSNTRSTLIISRPLSGLHRWTNSDCHITSHCLGVLVSHLHPTTH